MLNRSKLTSLIEKERELYVSTHQNSLAAFKKADNLFGRVPMTWMSKWSGGFPIYLQSAHGNRITDIDGNEYIDFALGDTGAMAGHSPKETADAIQKRISELGGITTMLPTEDAQWVGAELTRRIWIATLVFHINRN